MAHLLLDIVPKDDGNFYFSGDFGSSLGEALVYALIGFVVVLLGIALIIFIIWLIGFVLRKTNNFAYFKNLSFKKRKPEPESVVDEIPNDEISEEIKAAIVAAIMTYYCSEKPECEFRVKRIKKL